MIKRRIFTGKARDLALNCNGRLQFSVDQVEKLQRQFAQQPLYESSPVKFPMLCTGSVRAAVNFAIQGSSADIVTAGTVWMTA